MHLPGTGQRTGMTLDTSFHPWCDKFFHGLNPNEPNNANLIIKVAPASQPCRAGCNLQLPLLSITIKTLALIITFFCLVCYSLPWKYARPMDYDLFISYARQDNQQGRITELKQQFEADYRAFTGTELRCFFDLEDIKGMDDWRHRLLAGLALSAITLVFLVFLKHR